MGVAVAISGALCRALTYTLPAYTQTFPGSLVTFFRITKGITKGGDCHFTAAGPACPLDVLGLGKMWAPGWGLQRSRVRGYLLPWNIPGDLDVPWTVSGSYS